MLDVFAFLTLVAELEAAHRVAADLSARHLAVAERLGDDHVLVHAAICGKKKKNVQFQENLNKFNSEGLDNLHGQSTFIGDHVRVQVHVHAHHGVHGAEEAVAHARHGREQILEALERVVEYGMDAPDMAGTQ